MEKRAKKNLACGMKRVLPLLHSAHKPLLGRLSHDAIFAPNIAMRNILQHIAVLLQLVAIAPLNTLMAFGVTSHAANPCCAPQPTAAAVSHDGTHCPPVAQEADFHTDPSPHSGCIPPGGDAEEHPTHDSSNSTHVCFCCFVGTIAHRAMPAPPVPLVARPNSPYLPSPLSPFAVVIDHPPCWL